MKKILIFRFLVLIGVMLIMTGFFLAEILGAGFLFVSCLLAAKWVSEEIYGVTN